VVARGTARAMAPLSAYVGGKTGTSEDENDAWFIGFTNDVTVGIWVGYDNADGKRRTLGDGQTGGQVAVPIFAPIIEAAWANYASKTPLYSPSPEAAKELVALPIDLVSGARRSQRQAQAFTEYFRLRRGRLEDTQYRLVSPNETVAARDPGDGEVSRRGSAGGDDARGYYASRGGYYQGGYYQNRDYQGRDYQGGYYQGGANGRGSFQGSVAGRPFTPPPSQAQRPLYPPNAPPNGDVSRDAPQRYSEDRRPAPRIDPDVPWRSRQRTDW
jgi:membrane peptidoglycan carboxypeptidase